MAWWPVLAVLSIGLLLVAAKAHGRQVRLHRELHGHMDVSFRGGNHPFVDALWRRDRIRFWTTSGIMAVSLITLLGTAWRSHLEAWFDWLLVVPWAMVSGFIVAGLSALIGAERDLRASVAATKRAETYRGSRAGSMAWWLLVVALLATLVALAAAIR